MERTAVLFGAVNYPDPGQDDSPDEKGMLDLRPTLYGPDADAIRAEITAERREAQEKVWIMEVPFELGDLC